MRQDQTAGELPFERSALVFLYEQQHFARAYRADGDPLDRFLRHWHVSVKTSDGEGGADDLVATADVVIVDLAEISEAGENVLWLLDGESGDLLTIGQQIFSDDGEFVPDLERLALLHSGVLLLDRVWVDPRFRGHGLGPFVTAIALDRLRLGCGFAACYPAPYEGDHDDEALKRAIAALGRTWAKVGFKRFRKGIWILDFGTTTHARRLDQLTRSAA